MVGFRAFGTDRVARGRLISHLAKVLVAGQALDRKVIDIAGENLPGVEMSESHQGDAAIRHLGKKTLLMA